MKAQILTAEEIRVSEGRNYNPQIWESNVDRMITKYKDVVFYHVSRDEQYSYDRYYVEYTLDSGLRLLGKFTYSSSLTNGGFYRLGKAPMTADGRSMKHAIEFMDEGDNESAKALFTELSESKFVDLVEKKFLEPDSGEMVMINTSKEAREWMTNRSKEYAMVFTKGF